MSLEKFLENFHWHLGKSKVNKPGISKFNEMEELVCTFTL